MNNLGTIQGEEAVDAESAEQLLQAIHIKADHDLIVDYDRRSGLAVQADQLLQGLRVGGHILVFKGDLARAEEMFGSKAGRTSGLAVKDYTFL